MRAPSWAERRCVGLWAVCGRATCGCACGCAHSDGVSRPGSDATYGPNLRARGLLSGLEKGGRAKFQRMMPGGLHAHGAIDEAAAVVPAAAGHALEVQRRARRVPKAAPCPRPKKCPMRRRYPIVRGSECTRVALSSSACREKHLAGVATVRIRGVRPCASSERFRGSGVRAWGRRRARGLRLR